MEKTLLRTFFLLIALSLFSVSCGKRSASSGDGSSRKETPGADSKNNGGDAKPVDTSVAQRETESGPNDPLEAAGDEPASGVSSKNAELLEKERAIVREVYISHDATKLPEKEKKMLEHLIEAARLTQELYMLQLHPRNMEWRQKVLEMRDPLRQKLFARFRSPWCLENPCALLDDLPPKKLLADFWPDDLTDEEFSTFDRQINGRELLSPFTVVRRREGRGYDAIPYARFERYSTRMRVIADELVAASKLAPDPSLARFLLSRAKAFSAQSAFPFDESDYDWISLKGDWEVTIGPYETYQSPRQTKALFQMVLGRVEPELTAQMSSLEQHLPAMETALAELLGPELYKPGNVEKKAEIRVIDVWYAAGEARLPKGALLAYHLPNRGPSADEGLSKKVILANHFKAFDPLTRIRAKMSFSPKLARVVDPEAKMKNTVFHEIAHGLIANADTKIVNKKGKATTVKLALGKHEAVVEELKADAVALWLAGFGVEQGWLGEQELEKRLACAVLHALGLLMHPRATPSARMSAVELGFLLDREAIVWDEKNEKIDVNFDKAREAVEELVKTVLAIQLTGDREAAEALEQKYSLEGKGGQSSQIARIRKALQDAFVRDKIPTPALTYEVEGLSPVEVR